RNDAAPLHVDFKLSWRGAAAFLREPMTECGQRTTLNLGERIFYFNVNCNTVTKRLVSITFRDNCKVVGHGGMERGFLNQKGSGGGRGVKEKGFNRNSMNTSSGIGVSTKSDDTMNDDPLVVASTIKEDVTPSVVDMMVEKEKISSLEVATHSDENQLKEDFSTVPDWVKLYGVPVTAFSEDGLSAIATKIGFAKVMIELRADVELKDHIVVVMPKITREGHYTCNVHIEYEWKPPRCSLCKVFGHIREECPKNTGAGENKNVKKPSQTSRVRSHMHFGIDVDDEVLHKAVTVVKESTFIDQVVKFVVDTKEDCTKNDGCLCKIVCDDS
ncbi:RNA-directed DNA polymerase, eukaryota, reverse transcriptase zinc-binding domain protein, partial [Tanacetum coccineum]